jgi:hypothetical protein
VRPTIRFLVPSRLTPEQALERIKELTRTGPEALAHAEHGDAPPFVGTIPGSRFTLRPFGRRRLSAPRIECTLRSSPEGSALDVRVRPAAVVPLQELIVAALPAGLGLLTGFETLGYVGSGALLSLFFVRLATSRNEVENAARRSFNVLARALGSRLEFEAYLLPDDTRPA